METLSLENDYLTIRILPSHGGKLVSLRSVRTGEEFLLPPLNPYRHVSALAPFSESDGGGFDECLPSVASCESMEGMPPVADHGDLWRKPWQVDARRGAIMLHTEAASRPLRLSRTAFLQETCLVLDYELLNLSDRPTTWLWSAHPLLSVEAGDRILLPKEIENVAVEYSAGDNFKRGSSIDWPLATTLSGERTDLRVMGEQDGTTAHKLFARMEQQGFAALYRHRAHQGIAIQFDSKMLPFLGLWVSCGAWPQEGVQKQYTVALEPTTSSVDSLAAASKNGTARVLNPHEQCHWRLEFHLLGASHPLELDVFMAATEKLSNIPDR